MQISSFVFIPMTGDLYSQKDLNLLNVYGRYDQT